VKNKYPQSIAMIVNEMVQDRVCLRCNEQQRREVGTERVAGPAMSARPTKLGPPTNVSKDAEDIA
jgi:hypothetical protein